MGRERFSEISPSEDKGGDNNPDRKTPEQVLLELANYNKEYLTFPLEAVADGSFAGNGKLQIDEDGRVVLIRHAHDKDHLLKLGRVASIEQMREASLYTGGLPEAGAVHTSADVSGGSGQYPQYEMYGIFKIPVKDFLAAGQVGKIYLGNLGEQEIIVSGDIAEKYLAEVVERLDRKPSDIPLDGARKDLVERHFSGGRKLSVDYVNAYMGLWTQFYYDEKIDFDLIKPLPLYEEYFKKDLVSYDYTMSLSDPAAVDELNNLVNGFNLDLERIRSEEDSEAIKIFLEKLDKLVRQK
jgi:hypothetical protein